MRFWILVGGSVLVLAAAIWPFGRPSPEPTFPAVVKDSRTPGSHKSNPSKPEPAKVVEVIDLSRAYEPVREREEAIDPATFIEIGPPVERLDVMPREVIPIGNGLLEFAPIPQVSFTPMGVPYDTNVVQPIPPNAAIQNGLLNFIPSGLPIERLEVMPREVPDDPYRGLLDEVRRAIDGPDWSSYTPAWDVEEQQLWPPQRRPSDVNALYNGPTSTLFDSPWRTSQVVIFSMMSTLNPIQACSRRVSLEDYITRLDVMPREVCEFSQGAQTGTFGFGPLGLPAPLNDSTNVERVAASPRVIPARFVVEDTAGRLLHYVETADDAVVRVSHGDAPASERLTQPIPRKAFSVPLIPVERLTVEPRMHVARGE
jgi:hypothetical protein